MRIYVAEAHTKDTWPMPIGIEACRHNMPQTIEQRVAIADEYVDLTAKADEGQPMAQRKAVGLLVDGMDNGFSSAYGAWPERFVVLEERLTNRNCQSDWFIGFLSEPHPDGGHKMDDLHAWLEARLVCSNSAAGCAA